MLNFSGFGFFLIGIKGTGMSTLAVILKKAGAKVLGCDSAEVFPTDEVLKENSIEVLTGFGKNLLPPDTQFVVYSAAYNAVDCPVLALALYKEGINTLSYPEFLTLLTNSVPSYAVAGTHGKTTSAAVASYVLTCGKRSGFPFFSVFGSTLPAGPVFQGTETMILEACEYREHFLRYRLKGALVLSIDFDHPDFFKSLCDVEETFRKFVFRIAEGGFLIVCTDSGPTRDFADFARINRPDLNIIEFGFNAKGPFAIRKCGVKGSAYTIAALTGLSFDFKLYSRALVSDFVGSCLLASAVLLDRPDPKLYLDGNSIVCDEIFLTLLSSSLSCAQHFPGLKQRCEVVAELGGTVLVNDYAHHPEEIKTCIENIRGMFPGKKLTVCFCPHTYSRTDAFSDAFAKELSKADNVIIQKTYATVREGEKDDAPGRELAEKLKKRMLSSSLCTLGSAVYISSGDELYSYLRSVLNGGGVLLALGAGNNRHILFDLQKIIYGGEV